MKKEQVSVDVKFPVKTEKSSCVIARYDQLDAIKRVVLLFIFAFVFILPTFFIPYGMYFSVPIGFFIALFFAIKIYRKWYRRKSILNGKTLCGKCKKTFQFSFADTEKPLEGICPRCATHFSIEQSQIAV